MWEYKKVSFNTHLIMNLLLSDVNALNRNVSYSNGGYNVTRYWPQWGNSLFT